MRTPGKLGLKKFGPGKLWFEKEILLSILSMNWTILRIFLHQRCRHSGTVSVRTTDYGLTHLKMQFLALIKIRSFCIERIVLECARYKIQYYCTHDSIFIFPFCPWNLLCTNNNDIIWRNCIKIAANCFIFLQKERKDSRKMRFTRIQTFFAALQQCWCKPCMTQLVHLVHTAGRYGATPQEENMSTPNLSYYPLFTWLVQSA